MDVLVVDTAHGHSENVLQAIARGLSYGFEIMEASGLPDGTVYPALRRLEQAGLLASSWEDQEAAHAEKRPARRHYHLTAEGRRALASALERFPGLHAVVVSSRARGQEA